MPGVFIVGDLTGIPLLKFALDSGARAVAAIAADPSLRAGGGRTGANDDVVDVAIVGGGVAGMAAAVEARRRGLSFVVVEGSEAFSTIANFPQAKPIFTYPARMVPEGALQVSAPVKEELLEELARQVEDAGVTWRLGFAERLRRGAGGLLEVVLAEGEPIRARRVVVAIGRSGNFRKIGVGGEERERVYNRLHDPRDFAGNDVLVVGGGDSAIEAAVALAQRGARVSLSYRRAEFSRPKPDNLDALRHLLAHPTGGGSIRLLMASRLRRIDDRAVDLETADGATETIPNDHVFAMIGRAAPLDFFRRSGIRIQGEGTPTGWVALALFLVVIAGLYNWKSGGALDEAFDARLAWPKATPAMIASWGDAWAARVEDRATLVGTLAMSMRSNAFYFTLLYTAVIVVFGARRMRRRPTAYVRAQTATLMAVQVVPLFLLPEVVLPYLGYNGWFTDGIGRTIADNLFPLYISAEEYAEGWWPDWGHPRAYWMAYGLILAWPLNVYNVFTDTPQTWWLVICAIQTFLLIPGMIYFWGKGAYCGWICSCGALAETLGDDQRHKMPHGPGWNRLNMAGQAILAVAFVLLAARVWGWVAPEGAVGAWINAHFPALVSGKVWSNEAGKNVLVSAVNYKWWVDVFLGGVIGVGLYFKYSGRVWCRFFCPLAALMHVYARFSRFRIFADKKKCISCNVCTSVCHQGIDVMSFANKGLPMEDPECVRCSACVQGCPTGVLTFGQIDRATGEPLRLDGLNASLVQLAEGRAAAEAVVAIEGPRG